MKHSVAIYALALTFTLFLAGNLPAATFVVTNTNDSGPGSLRQAILSVTGNSADDEINFDPSVFNTPRTITLTSGEFPILFESETGPVYGVTLNGPGAHLLTISGNNQSRLFSMEWRTKLTINGVKLTGGNGVGASPAGYPNYGGAILASLATGLTIRNCLISGNSAPKGGALFAMTELVVENSAIIDNTATLDAGGVYTSNAKFVNTTFRGNTAGGDGGAVYVGYRGSIEFTNSVVVANFAVRGGGVASDSYYMNTGAIYPRNSIIARNITTGPEASDMQDVHYISYSRNIVDNVCCNIRPPTSDLVNIDPKLDWNMKTNSVGVPYFALKADSPAVDNGDNCVINTTANGGCVAVPAAQDIRGVTRPQNGDGNGNALVDIGVFEISETEYALIPGKPDLSTSDDTGISSTDNITRSRNLNMQVGNLIIGETVRVYRNGTLIQTFTATATSTTISDLNLPADGNFSYHLTQTSSGAESLAGSALDVTVDNTRPGSTLYQPGFQPDPTRDTSIRFVIGFTEPIFGLTNSDISLASSTAGVSGATVSVAQAYPAYIIYVYNLTTDGQVIATMAENLVTDAAGNQNTTSTYMDNSVTLDRTSPTVTINQAAGQADPATGTINFTAIFSEAVTGFNHWSISLTGSTADVSAVTITITGTGPTYNVAIGNIRSSGIVRASIPSGRVIDQVGFNNPASTSTDNTVTFTYTGIRTPFDYDGDGKSDVSVFRPSDNNWYLQQSSAGLSIQGFGLSTDVLTPADYDGDGKTDLGIFRPSTGTWWYKSSINGGYFAGQWGASGDVPLPGDFDGDGKADFVFYRPSDSTWYRLGSTGIYSPIAFGTAGDIPLVADMDGDGKTDPTVYRPSMGTWWYASSANGGYYAIQWGTATVIPVAGDFDGDGKADPAYFRPSDGVWSVLYSGTGYTTYTSTSWGLAGDRPVAGDYDGDGRTDLAVYRPSNSMWFVVRSTQGFYSANFGIGGDRPTPAAFVP